MTEFRFAAADDLDDDAPIEEAPVCEADRYNQHTESYDGVCLTFLRADGTCPRAWSHAGVVGLPNHDW